MQELLTGLENFDVNLFKQINGMHSPMWDTVMWYVSYKYLWIPLYLLIVFLFFRAHGWKGAGIALLAGVATVGLTDLIATYGLKETVMRYRPSHNEDFQHLVHLVKDFNGNEYKGGQYGFVSGHAANSFAIAIFSGQVLRKKFSWVLPVMVFWALVISYSRIYMGVHYPADVIFGGLLGGTIGYLFSLLYTKIILKKLQK